MARHVVARVGEIPPGARKIVEVGGRSIAVFNLDGEFYALRNRCPHQGAPLCTGMRFSRLESSGPGDYQHGGGDLIRCPWHGWEFDIRTGRSWFDPARTRVRGYPVERAAGPSDQLVPGPYAVEAPSVSVEADYLVVEL